MKRGYINLKTYSLAYWKSNISEIKNKGIFENYCKINGLESLSKRECKDLYNLFSDILMYGNCTPSKYYGYLLDKTVKFSFREQFDILRFSKNTILNIELKSDEISEDDILDQLDRHYFLLQSIAGQRKVNLFTFVDPDKILYKYDNGELIKVDIETLVKNIDEDYIEEDILSKVSEEDFLISPYSKIDKFIDSKYFLNDEQKENVNKILSDNSLDNILLTGGPGTGKSLILFDLANRMSTNGKNVLLLFCSRMDEWRDIDNVVDFTFRDIKNISFEKDFSEYDILLIDEAQRLRKDQFELLVKKNIKIVFAVDQQQTLKPDERNLNIEELIRNEISEKNCLTLKEKVRTDLSLQTFILKFLKKGRKGLQPMEFPKVNVVYFETKSQAIEFIKDCIQTESYYPIELPQYSTFTTGVLKNRKIYSGSADGFTVIGREYDNVIIPIDNRTRYKDNGDIEFYINEYFPYLSVNSMFQALTRVRKNLLFVIIENVEMCEEICDILTWNQDRNKNNAKERIIRLREMSGKSISEVANELKLNEKTYLKIEETGNFNTDRTLRKVANYFNVETDFITGNPIPLAYTDFDIYYHLVTKNKSKKEKNIINQRLINLLLDLEKEDEENQDYQYE